jgi:hypothetical protein
VSLRSLRSWLGAVASRQKGRFSPACSSNDTGSSGAKARLVLGILSQRWQRCATQNRSGDGAGDTRISHFVRDDASGFGTTTVRR